MNNLTDEEKIALSKHEKRKAQNRANSKRYYAKTAPEILAKRKQERMIKKVELNNIKNKLKKPVPTNFDCNELNEFCGNNNNNDDFNDDFNIPSNFENEIVENENYENYKVEDIEKLIKNDTSISSETTRKSYMSSIRRAFSITKCEKFKNCLNNYNQMIKYLENNKKFKINTIKLTIQSLLFVFDKYNVLNKLFNNKKAQTIKKAFVKVFDKFKDKSNTELKNTQNTIEYPTWDEYLNKVNDMFGNKSKEYLIALLYSQFSVRDDYKNLKIIKIIKDDNKKDNFIVITDKKMLIIINKFKTQNKYKRLEFKVTGVLKTLIYEWTKNKNYGDTLFGKSSLSSFVSNLNKKLGYENLGGINAYRHIAVSELYKNEDLTFDEKYKKANQMGHNLLTQEDYKRQLKVI